MATTRIKAERFPDLDNEVLYPRLSEQKMAWLAERGVRRSFAAGEVLYEQGLRDAPFFVIESGRVDLIDRKPGKEIWIAEADAGTFIGDIATFTGEPAMAQCVASEPTETIAFDRPGLRAMLAASPEMGELPCRLAP
jgi:thioredoxin reductase (NADPH)